MKQAAIVGYYGMSNVGDDAFALVLAEYLPAYWHTSVALCAPSGPGIPAGTRTLPSVLFGAHSGPRHLLLTASKLLTAATCDGIVYGGGSVFTQAGALSEKRSYRALARTLGKSVAAVGVSIGPFKSTADERRLGPILESLHFIYLRDRQSLNYLGQLRLQREPVIGADLVSLLYRHPALLSTDQDRPSDRRLGLGVLGWDPQLSTEAITTRNDSITEAVADCALESDAEVSVFAMNRHPVKGDLSAAQRSIHLLASRGIRSRLITGEHGPLHVMRELRRCSAGVQVRLHGGICSFVAESPFILVPYHEKCDSFLNEIGMATSLRVERVPGREEVRTSLRSLLCGSPAPSLTALKWRDSAIFALGQAPWAVA